MAQKGSPYLLRGNARAVVGNADEAVPALLQLHRNHGSAGVDGVFGQLLYDRGRALHDFACRNFINRILV